MHAQKPRFAIIVDESPFPPRNGVTIPTHQLCVALAALGHEYELFLLVPDFHARETSPLHRQLLDAYRVPVHLVERKRSSTWQGARDELLLRKPRFANWHYCTSLPDLSAFDILIASPISALDFLIKVKQPHQRAVALISDVYFSVLYSDNQPQSTITDILKGRITRCRSFIVGHLEAQLLGQVDRIIVQTPLDIAWLRLIGGRNLASRARAHHNSANQDLFNEHKPAIADKRRIAVFSADLKSTLYQRNLEQLLEAWPSLLEQVRDARLHITGSRTALPGWLRAKAEATPGVELLGFVDNIADIYRHARIAIAPVFKRYGFINKVAEAIAAGVPVISDKSGFNGMAPLLSAQACFDAATIPDIIPHAVRLLTDDALWEKSSSICSAYALSELSPQIRHSMLIRAVMP